MLFLFYLSLGAIAVVLGFVVGVLYGAHIVTGQGRLKDHISEEIGRLRQELKRDREQFLKKF